MPLGPAAGLLLVTAGAADLDLAVRHDPAPVQLAMRRLVEDEPPSPRAQASRRPAAFSRLAEIRPLGAQDLEELERRVVFRFQLGYAVDQGDVAHTSITGVNAPDNVETRLYTFGDAVVGTNGIVARPLSSYLAGRFRFDQDQRPPEATSIPSIYDQRDLGGALFIRHGYAQVAGMGPAWLQPLRIRAGRQYRYGVGVTHFDGLTAAYETRPLELGVHAGQRVVLYRSDQYDTTGATELSPTLDERGTLAGASARIRLFPATRAPVEIRGETLFFDGVRHLRGSMALSPRPDITLIGEGRMRQDRWARLNAAIRARLSDVTLLSAEIDSRTEEDWLYDLVVTGEHAATDPRMFLLLGPVLPRTRLTARAGTVLFSNLDVFVTLGAAAEHDPEERESSFTPSYTELGGAMEARFRGGLAGGADFLLRRFRRNDPPLEEAATGMRSLVDVGAWGERASRTGNVHLGYVIGEHRFNVESLFYFRQYDDVEHDAAQLAAFAGQPIGTITTTRLGGMFRIEGWVGRRLRTLLEYEVTGLLGNVARELAGLHAVRLLGEAIF